MSNSSISPTSIALLQLVDEVARALKASPAIPIEVRSIELGVLVVSLLTEAAALSHCLLNQDVEKGLDSYVEAAGALRRSPQSMLALGDAVKRWTDSMEKEKNDAG